MSAEFEMTRDKDGFLNCKYCPRIFRTKIIFENHSSSQHKKDTETKPDVHHIQESQTITDESSIQKNIQFEKCSLGNSSFSGCKLRPYKFLSQAGFEPGSFSGYNQLRDGMSP